MVTIYYAMKLYDGLKLGGLVDDACYLVFSEVKKDFGLRSIFRITTDKSVTLPITAAVISLSLKSEITSFDLSC